MSKILDSFLCDVCSHIQYKGIHSEVKEELSQHIEELKESYIGEGLSEDEAMKKAVFDMGSASEIGQKLNKQHKPQTEWSLILLTALVSVFGILVMYVSRGFENQPVSFGRHILYVVLGAAVLAGMYFVDYTKLKKHPGLLFSAAVFLLVFCVFFGTEYNGARRWIRIGSVGITVNAIAGILLVTAFCGFVEKYRGEGFIGIVKLMLWGLGSVVLFMVQPSLSMVFILFVAYAVVLLRAISLNHFEGNKKVQMISLLSLGGISALSAFLYLLFESPGRMERMLLFWNNGASDLAGGGWIYAMADKLLKASNLIGKATPLSEGSIDWVLPSITTDFALVNVINSFGWVAGIALMLIIAVFIARMFMASNRVKNSFGFYLSLISCVMLTVQFVTSVLMNLGCCPYMDVSLPFISYGGTNYIANMIYVGLILSVWRKNNLLPKPQRNIRSKEKRVTFVDHKLIIDFGANKPKNI